MDIFQGLGAAKVIGSRSEQQDMTLSLDTPWRGVVAVFDGHGIAGRVAAHRAKHWVERAVTEQPTNPHLMSSAIGFVSMRALFPAISANLLQDEINGGSTATVVQISPPDTVIDGHKCRRIVTANVGDSPALLIDPHNPYRKGGVIHLTTMHNATNPDEVRRMRDEHGVTVDRNGYFRFNNGRIMVSRALGDGKYGLSSKPSHTLRYSKRERLVLVASDGVLAPQTAEEVVESTVERFHKGYTMSAIALHLTARFSRETQDNASVVLAHLPPIQ